LLKLLRPTCSRLPSSQSVCTGSPTFFCIKEPGTPQEEFRSQVNVGGQDQKFSGSVIKDGIPQIREAALQVKDAVHHLKVGAENPPSRPSNQSKNEEDEEDNNSEVLKVNGIDSNSDLSPLPDERKLLRELSAKIRFSGPITVAEYMREVAINPIHGFYVSQEALGKHGHFVTSPELSQMFGECVAVWLLHEWMKMGEPGDFQLVELGPGKGTLLTDILRTLSKLQPGLVQGISLHLVEVSSRMKKEQELELGIKDGLSKWGASVHWHDHIADVPQKFSFFIAHEFLDALPVNKFERSEDSSWREVLVDIDEEREGELRYVISRNATPSCVLLEGLDLEGVHKTELCPNAGLVIREVGKRVAEYGGAALIVDYGEEKGEELESAKGEEEEVQNTEDQSLGNVGEKVENSEEKKGLEKRIERDTLRAFRHHKQVHPLELPGTADITADVDFSYIRSQVPEHTAMFGPVEQGDWLHACGIGERCAQLTAGTEGKVRDSLLECYKTLTDKEMMGARFKVCSLHPASMGEIHAKYPPVGLARREQ